MGHKQSTAKHEGFMGVLPSEQRTKQVTTGEEAQTEAPALARPVETAIPVIHTPPHALVRDKNETELPGRRSSSVFNRPETPRRGGEDPQTALAVPESVRKSHTLQQFEQTCSEIIADFLHVSNLQVAQDLSKLQGLGITHIINCCKEVVCFQPVADDSITYLQLALRDGVQEDLLPFFPQVIRFIERSRQIRDGESVKSKVLIHCHQGVSRSCAFAIAYVMYNTHYNFQDANAIVKAKRSICSPNTAFICQLIEWERELAAAASSNTASYGLFRLAPHAPYDPSTLVLKQCYHKESRRKVSIPSSDGNSDAPAKWLWPRGVFVYIDHLGQVVLWKGAHCVIDNGIAKAKQKVETMLEVYAGGATRAELSIIVVEQQLYDVVPTEDAFQYADELAWLEPLMVPAKEDEAASVEGGSTTMKPILFILEGNVERTWELISDYSSDDLLADSVLLLITPSESFLWMGSRFQTIPVEKLEELAAQQCSIHTSSSSVLIERQEQESEAFWDAFEAGY